MTQSNCSHRYLIADYDRREFTTTPSVWPSTFNQDYKGIRPPGDVIINITSNTPIEAIVGGILGGLVVIGLVVFALWFCKWRPRGRQGGDQHGEHNSNQETPHEGFHAYSKVELDVPDSSASSDEHTQAENYKVEMDGQNKWQLPLSHPLEMDGQHKWQIEAALRGDHRLEHHAEMEEQYATRFELATNEPLRAQLEETNNRTAATSHKQ